LPGSFFISWERPHERPSNTASEDCLMAYQIKPLSCDPAKIKGMSERLIVSHYENNYAGAVKRLNLIEEQLAELDYAKAAGFLINGLKREQLVR
jgi:superoxide dismutase, Fe-Mn family